MHAVYHYLMHIEPEEGSTPGQVAVGAFERYAEGHLDENNWWAPIDLVMKDGGYFYEFEDGTSDRYNHTEKAPTWDEAVRFALDCIVTDFQIRDQQRWFSIGEPTEAQEQDDEAYRKLAFPEVVSFVHTEVPKRLVVSYGAILGKPWAKDDLKFDMEGYRRARLVHQYELFRDSNVPPFAARVGSPYEYRAYDLTGSYAEGEPNAILRLDIHT